MPEAWPWREAVVDLLARTRIAQPDGLSAAVNAALRPLGVRMTLYLVDKEQRALRALPEPDRPAPPGLAVDSTVAGRAFTSVRAVPATDDPRGGSRLWLPLLDGTERLGVVEVTASRPGAADAADFAEQCDMFAALVGHLITVKMPYGDFLVTARRTQRMSEASELVWRLLPPLTYACDRMVISAVLEPCYDVGGDGFDYAVGGSRAFFTILDTVGHGLSSGLGTAVALSAMRAARRAGDGLVAIAEAADAALVEYIADSHFATAVVAELDLDTGLLRYLNAGHPRPLLLRRGKVVRELAGGRRMPLGLADPKIEVAEEMLEFGDRLLLYTDGVIEARDRQGAWFGEGRLIELFERHAAADLPAPETLRRLCHAALAHYDGPPRDDATLLLVEWSARAAGTVLP
ncbi:PP2C family protein-serine/threonine phosphatase [Luedemannella helvata]|uniref:PP2C family protein-serine/threonine phosphatase n=1 Tax=Luedemannella helvata TaxID=349315 RepID=A0ABP4WU37_9ACTN